MSLLYIGGAVFQADGAHVLDLEAEIGASDMDVGGLYYKKEPPLEVFWYRNMWEEPFLLEFSSINEAAKALRGIQRNWVYTDAGVEGLRGRARLIQEALPFIADKRRPLDWVAPASPLGSWTLLTKNTLLGSAKCASPFPNGRIEFIENKTDPPSRAYLKLAEVFARFGCRPQKGDACIDLGASPGSWTWLLSALGAEVLAVDRAPLEERINNSKNVTFCRHDAFTLEDAYFADKAWVFCDAACYPARLLAFIEKRLASGRADVNYVCTIKMQGAGDMESVRALSRIPGSRVAHLYHNKHELTWIRLH